MTTKNAYRVLLAGFVVIGLLCAVVILARRVAESFRTPVIILTDANLATGVQPIPRPDVTEDWFPPPLDQSAWDEEVAPYDWDEKTGLSERPANSPPGTPRARPIAGCCA